MIVDDEESRKIWQNGIIEDDALLMDDEWNG